MRELPMAPPPRVLVVDDMPETLDAFASLVRHALPAAAVRQEADSRQAVRALDAGGFEIVVSDLRMPFVNGLQLLTFARERWPASRRVLMSADGEPMITEALLRSYGIDAFVHKPFDAPQIVHLLRTLAATPHAPPTILPPRSSA